jgi:SAM-dependent methyltransferase
MMFPVDDTEPGETTYMDTADRTDTTDQDAASPGAVLTAVGALGTAVEQATLVRLALSSGLLQRAVEPVSESDLARALQAPVERVSAVCDALVAMGALERDGGAVRLTPDWAPLAADGVDVTLERSLAGAIARQQTIAAALSPSVDYWQADAQQRRDMADGVTLATTTGFGQAVVSGVLEDLPEIDERLRAGARWLELGCGVAGMLLGTLHAYPKVTAVGVDIAGDLLDLAAERARQLGVADRVSFVRADATTYSDDEQFDIVFWSQFFFPAQTRRAALANAAERLRPGGRLLCPLVPGDLEPAGSTSTFAQQSALHALVFSGWGVPILSGEELADELSTAGFRVRSVRRNGLPVILVAEHA